MEDILAKKGARVKVKANLTTRLFKWANRSGVVVGPDPSPENNKSVFAIKMDDDGEIKGIHTVHLKVIG